MTQEIENRVVAIVERYEVKLRQLGIKLVSITLSCWMIVGSLSMGILLPAYVVARWCLKT